MPGPAIWAAVAVGALAGTEARYGLLTAFPPGNSSVDWTTLAINAAASLALGFLTARWLFAPSVPQWIRAGLGPGFLGSFSTFSALALHLDRLLVTDRPGAFVLYLLLSLVLGILGAAAGLMLGRLAGTLRRNRAEPA